MSSQSNGTVRSQSSGTGELSLCIQKVGDQHYACARCTKYEAGHAHKCESRFGARALTAAQCRLVRQARARQKNKPTHHCLAPVARADFCYPCEPPLRARGCRLQSTPRVEAPPVCRVHARTVWVEREKKTHTTPLSRLTRTRARTPRVSRVFLTASLKYSISSCANIWEHSPR